jgi:hypothetical protein
VEVALGDPDDPDAGRRALAATAPGGGEQAGARERAREKCSRPVKGADHDSRLDRPEPAILERAASGARW